MLHRLGLFRNRPEEKQSTDLGVIKVSDGNVVDVAIPTDEKDINAAYDVSRLPFTISLNLLTTIAVNRMQFMY